jgi:drug/metabolite transporter (DMT)-like permease
MPGGNTFINVIFSVLFVILWSSGFVVGKFGLAYVQPLPLLLIRYLASVAILGLYAFLSKASWPKQIRQFFHIAVVGVLIHVIYLGGVFIALDHGVPSGTVTLITTMQPVFTAIIALWLIKEKVGVIQWIGIITGFFGVTLVISNSVGLNGDAVGYGVAFVATLSLSCGILYEKKYCRNISLINAMVIQYGVASFFLIAVILPMEVEPILWRPGLLFSLAWLVLMCSIGSYLLLFHLARTGSPTSVATLTYLTPPAAMVIAFFLFGEILGASGLLGTFIAILSVLLVSTYSARNQIKAEPVIQAIQNGPKRCKSR